MTPIPRIPALALAACLVAVAACDDGTTGPVDAPSGSLSFSYSGAQSGSFSATGQYGEDRTGSFEWRPFAVGLRYFDNSVNAQTIDIFGVAPRSGTRGDAVDLFIDDLTQPRALSLDLEACLLNRATLDVRDGCAVGLFAFDASPQTGAGEIWLTRTGTLTVEAVSAGRIRGSFSGTLVNEDDDVITVSGGTFDVPVVNRDDVSRLSRSLARAEMRAAAARVLATR